jgi:hypothetical protein
VFPLIGIRRRMMKNNSQLLIRRQVAFSLPPKAICSSTTSNQMLAKMMSGAISTSPFPMKERRGKSLRNLLLTIQFNLGQKCGKR